MPDPLRLKDGTDDLAAALREEQQRAARLPVDTMKARLLAAFTAGMMPLTLSASLSSLLPLVFVAALSVGAVLGAAGHALWQERSSPLAIATPMPDEPSPSPPNAVPSAVPSRLPSPVAPAPSVPARDVRPGASMEEASRTLPKELRLFERGQGAFDEGRFAVAVRELRAYLASFPKGRMRPEAAALLVLAGVRSGRFEDACEDAVAAEEAGIASTGLRVAHLEALVHLGRCEEARAQEARVGAHSLGGELRRRCPLPADAGPSAPTELAPRAHGD